MLLIIGDAAKGSAISFNSFFKLFSYSTLSFFMGFSNFMSFMDIKLSLCIKNFVYKELRT